MNIEIPPRIARQLEGVAAARKVSVESLVLHHLSTLIPAVPAKSAARQLDWMNGYSGQTTEELLAFEKHEQSDLLAKCFEDGIRRKIELTHNWTGVERTVISVVALHREVHRGGFQQFFRSPSRRHPLTIVEDLERIGCPAVGNIAQIAIDALGLRDLTMDGIEKSLIKDDAARDRLFSRGDVSFYARNEIPRGVIAYVKANRDGFRF